MECEDYDVVVECLQEKYEVLWKLTQTNMDSNQFNIMDSIRLEQMDELEKAIVLWKQHKE